MKRFITLLLAAGVLVVGLIQTSEAKNMDSQKTLRLLMPQWQGGDYDIVPPTGEMYPLGSRLLAVIAPESDAPMVEVPVEPYTGAPRQTQNGVVWQDVLLRQVQAAHRIIEEHNPARIVMFGGECHVDQAPFAYLNEKYGGKVGLIWMDAHPDVTTPANGATEHAMVLGNLMGRGDPVLAKEVKVPYKPEQVLLVGIDGYNAPHEEQTIKDLGLRVLKPQEVMENSDAVLKWVRDNKFEYIAIHFDLDVLSPDSFRSQFPMNPEGLPFNTTKGNLTLAQATRLIKDVSAAADVVGLGFTEHMPWDAYNLRKMMREFPIMK